MCTHYIRILLFIVSRLFDGQPTTTNAQMKRNKRMLCIVASDMIKLSVFVIYACQLHRLNVTVFVVFFVLQLPCKTFLYIFYVFFSFNSLLFLCFFSISGVDIS